MPISPPDPDATISIQVENFPVRLWWKLLETAQQRKLSINYLVFSILASEVDYSREGESYDIMVKEIQEHLGEASLD